MPRRSDQPSSKHETSWNMKNNDKNTVFYNAFVPWEAETTANSDVFEGQVAKNTVIYSVFKPNVQKQWYLRGFKQQGGIKHWYLRWFYHLWR